MKKVNIGIITYNRHQGLLKLLNSLNTLVLDADFIINNIVIVDNSIDFNTLTIKKEILETQHSIILEHEKKPGIPFARNKVVQLSKEVDFIAFIDDDEVADSNWLLKLCETQKTFQCEVVQGPVIPRFEHRPKRWHIYYRKQRKTGDKLLSMATGCTLISMKVLNQFQEPFNTKLALTGGTDSLLGREIVRGGHDIRWCDEAIVYEYIPKSRTTTKWIVQRSFRGGNNYSIQLKILHKGFFILSKRAIVCLIHLFTGIMSLLLLLFPIKERFFPIKKIFEGIGGLIGLFNFKYEEYKR
jgi:glycosyltransferase involved in cell wall biosynthesis